ncbi:diguanylate cyclase [Blastopirellula marina]|uniref:diguanylate cyclase n=1 Tax=Blastopirellula marina TaxID=124 RepID=UPI001304B99B|nr:diguanylate cyclase [Blastopirellula marina]
MSTPTVQQFDSCPIRSRVLVVDDDKLIRTLISEFLTREGYEVVTADNCLQALDLLEDPKHEFKFMVTDWELPDGNGIDLIRHARHVVQSHYMYIVMATSHGDRENLTRALNSGADDFLTKPIDRSELIARIRAGQRILNLETRLTQLANTDVLTGLPTRRVFEELVAKEWSRAQRYRLPLSCVIFDIDFFKRINDIHGHAAGDQVLREIARVFASSVRKSDIICRYGGEEFCAILPETSSAQAYIWADNIRKRIAATEVILDAAVVNVTISLGLAEPLSEMEDLSDLIEVADHCLLEAKSKGRNQIVAFNELRESVCNDPSGHLESIFQGAIAADAMTPVVSTVTPQSSVFDISQFFLDYRIPSAPVVDDEGTLVGIVSEKDLMSVAVRSNPHEIEISEVMRRNLICYPPSISLRVVWEFLNRVSIRTVLITENGKAVGVLSRQSILRWFANTAWKRKDHGNSLAFQDEQEQRLAMRRLEQAAKILAETSRQLTYDVETRTPDEHGAMVIGTVSKMQDLMVELLASVGGNGGNGAMHLHSAIESLGE